MKKPMVVKIGGSTLGSHDTTLGDLVALQKRGIIPVVVHGGAKVVTGWLERQGVASRFVSGLRVTDAQALEIVVAVLAGLVNKELVAQVHSLGGRAIGLSGIDGGLIEGRIKDPELGYVGEVVRINPNPLMAVLGAGYIPIIAPVSIQSEAAPGNEHLLVNINGDVAACELAIALGAEKLIFLTDTEGVYDQEGRLLPRLAPSEVRSLLSSGVVSEGMSVKVEACLKALGAVGATQIIDGRSSHALLAAIEGRVVGTTIG